MSGSHSARTTKYTAERVTVIGQLTLPGCWSAVPVKSTETLSPRISTVAWMGMSVG